jgi:hypothetical protein
VEWDYRLTNGCEGWDLNHVDNPLWRLEVKQSETRQVWHGEEVVQSSPRWILPFDQANLTEQRGERSKLQTDWPAPRSAPGMGR